MIEAPIAVWERERALREAGISTSTDVLVTDHGSIVLFAPLTPQAQAWVAENVDEDAPWWAGALACESRYAGELAAGMIDAGLELAS